MKYLSFLLLFIPSVVFSQQADDVLGYWLTDEATAKIEIYKEAGKYNGRIVWIDEPNDENGNPKLDVENPDESLRSRPLMGLNLVSGFVFNDDQWEDGEIYDPKEGKLYSCRMRLKKNKLEVRGYVGVPMFGKTVVWTRTEL